MVKIVINCCYGGFGLSERAKQKLGVEYDYDLKRDDPKLVAVVEELGEESWGTFARLKVVDIPDHVNWQIAEYDGKEWVAEVHDTWR